METKIIDGRKIRNEILEEVEKEIKKLSFKPVFCDILVGNDPVSAQYVRMKAKNAEKIGMIFHHANFPVSISTEDLIKEIDKLNKIENMCGLIVQLPLPSSLDKRKILDAIDPGIDVDFLGISASKSFYSGQSDIGFPTAVACIKILDSLNLDLKNKNILVIGQGDLVGKPVTALLKFRGIDPEIVVKETENKEKIIKEADIIISGTGRGKLLNGNGIKEGVVIIDAGTSESNAGIVGDVDLESVKGIASFVSPVPGGVGPVTVGILLKNVLTIAKKKYDKQ